MITEEESSWWNYSPPARSLDSLIFIGIWRFIEISHDFWLHISSQYKTYQVLNLSLIFWADSELLGT